MMALFRDRPGWVERSAEVAEALTFSFGELRYRFPCETLCEEGESPDAALKRRTYAGLAGRYGASVPSAVVAQCERELELIARLSVAPYFLSVAPGRRDGALARHPLPGPRQRREQRGLLRLGVTAVDPARSNLLFERFLSAERAEPPDIDVDFEHERREEVIQDPSTRPTAATAPPW
jgi:error-prone DNA polymerase